MRDWISREEELKRNIAIALAGNVEFVRLANGNYNGKLIGFCVAEQINLALRVIEMNSET